jgi:hypothetical protein
MAPTKAGVSTKGARKPKGGQAKVFGIATTGDARAAQVLDSVGGRGADARPAWPGILKMMQGDTAERFDTKGRGLWRPLAPATIAAKARKNQDPRIMRATGALHRSLTLDRGRGALRRKSKYQMRYGSTVFYAQFHQEGHGVPKRILVEADAALQRRIVDALERYVVQGELPDRLAQRRR